MTERSSGRAAGLAILGAGLVLGAMGSAVIGMLRRPTPEPRPLRSDAAKSGYGERQSAGPWGDLYVERVWLAAPDELIPAAGCDPTLETWRVPATSLNEVRQLFAVAGLDATARDRWLGKTTCSAGESTCTIAADLGMREQLPAGVRGKLYGILGRYPDNAPLYEHHHFRPNEMDEWLASSGFGAELSARFRSLTWEADARVHFADVPALCAAAKPDERHGVFRALLREPALVVHLKLAHGADTTALAKWWTTNARPDVPSLFASMASMTEGAMIDVAGLMPSGPRQLLYRFQRAGDAPRDCYWTAMNFDTLVLDDRWLDSKEVSHRLQTEYRPVSRSEARFGDVMALFHDGAPIHVATYLAGDLVFTKNGNFVTRPWTIESIPSVLAMYGHRADPEVRFLHRDVDR